MGLGVYFSQYKITEEVRVNIRQVSDEPGKISSLAKATGRLSTQSQKMRMSWAMATSMHQGLNFPLVCCKHFL